MDSLRYGPGVLHTSDLEGAVTKSCLPGRNIALALFKESYVSYHQCCCQKRHHRRSHQTGRPLWYWPRRTLAQEMIRRLVVEGIMSARAVCCGLTKAWRAARKEQNNAQNPKYKGDSRNQGTKTMSLGGGQWNVPGVLFVLLAPKPPKVLPVLLLVWPKPPLPKPPPPKDILRAVAVEKGSCDYATD